MLSVKLTTGSELRFNLKRRHTFIKHILGNGCVDSEDLLYIYLDVYSESQVKRECRQRQVANVRVVMDSRTTQKQVIRVE